MTYEWQAAEGSRTMHILNADRDGWHTRAGRRKRSGPRALCGRYPQRNAEHPWLSWPAADKDAAKRVAHSYQLTQCPACMSALPRVAPD